MANTNHSQQFARNVCLGGNVLRGKDQKPYNGTIEYDYIIWIEHDVIFTADHVQRLIEHMEDETKHVVGGIVPVSENTFDVIDKGHWSFEEFIQKGCFQPFTRNDLVQKREALFEVEHASMNFICMRRGVLESVEYPWFKPLYYEFNVDVNDGSGNAVTRTICDFCSDDIALSRTLVDKGYSLWVDPMLTVGREHVAVLRFPHQAFVEEQKKQGTYEQTLATLREQ